MVEGPGEHSRAAPSSSMTRDASSDGHTCGAPGEGPRVNGVRIDTRDGAAIENETVLKVKALEDAEVVLVDAA